MNKYEVRL